MGGALLRSVRSRPASAPAVGASQIAGLVSHAAALADRMEAKPVPADPELRRQREEKVRILRAAAAAGQSALRRQAVSVPPAR